MDSWKRSDRIAIYLMAIVDFQREKSNFSSDRLLRVLPTLFDDPSTADLEQEIILVRLKQLLTSDEWLKLPERLCNLDSRLRFSDDAIFRWDETIVRRAPMLSEKDALKSKGDVEAQLAQETPDQHLARLLSESPELQRRLELLRLREESEERDRDLQQRELQQAAMLQRAYDEHQKSLRQQEEAENRFFAEQERHAKEVAAIRAARCIDELQACMNHSFLSVDNLYESNCSQDVSESEFDALKVEFIRSWMDAHGLQANDEQLRAIGAVHGNVQVVARAGSGKTATIVTRAFFLHTHCGVALDKMLFLAFNTDAAENMKKNLAAMLGGLASQTPGPHVMTFHALSNRLVPDRQEDLLCDRRNRNQPDDDTRELSMMVQGIIDDLRTRNPRFRERLRDLMLEHYREDWEEDPKFKDLLDRSHYIQYRRSMRRLTFGNDYVQSSGEKRIANFLFEHGISYKYEERYGYLGGKPYRPDFTIYRDGAKSIVIEYFGMEGASAKYDSQTKDKEQFWEGEVEKENAPRFIALRTDDIQRYDYQQRLKTILESAGCACTLQSEEQIWNRIQDVDPIKSFTNAVVIFIAQCRKRNLSGVRLAEYISRHSALSHVEDHFLSLASEILECFASRLQEYRRIDFDGLMYRAIDRVLIGHTVFDDGNLQTLEYVFIDEYQDFSEPFHRLIESIKSINRRVQFFCVGDDWQAINAFAGSDLRFYATFKQHFVAAQELSLSVNHRSSRNVVAASNTLMCAQGGRLAQARENAPRGGVFLCGLQEFEPTRSESRRFSVDKFLPALIRIIQSSLCNNKAVVLLARRDTMPWYVNEGIGGFKGRPRLSQLTSLLKRHLPDRAMSRIRQSTIHSFKGLEEETAIILDALDSSAPLLHPSWVFNRVFGQDLPQLIEEERRLFYVAMTRAKHDLCILTSTGRQTWEVDEAGGRPSPFLGEIRQNGYSLAALDWFSLPPVVGTRNGHVVQVHNQTGKGVLPTVEIKDQLKAARFQYEGDNYKFWTSPVIKGSIESLRQAPWALAADGIEVRKIDALGSTLARYAVNSGQWVCLESLDPMSRPTLG